MRAARRSGRSGAPVAGRPARAVGGNEPDTAGAHGRARRRPCGKGAGESSETVCGAAHHGFRNVGRRSSGAQSAQFCRALSGAHGAGQAVAAAFGRTQNMDVFAQTGGAGLCVRARTPQVSQAGGAGRPAAESPLRSGGARTLRRGGSVPAGRGAGVGRLSRARRGDSAAQGGKFASRGVGGVPRTGQVRRSARGRSSGASGLRRGALRRSAPHESRRNRRGQRLSAAGIRRRREAVSAGGSTFRGAEVQGGRSAARAGQAGRHGLDEQQGKGAQGRGKGGRGPHADVRVAQGGQGLFLFAGGRDVS